MAELVGLACVHGQPVDWAALCGPAARRIDLPQYPFQGRRYWLDQVSPEALIRRRPRISRTAPERFTGDPARLVAEYLNDALGYPADDPSRSFTDLGLTSRMAVELRNRLRPGDRRSTCRPRCSIDHPTPARLAAALRDSPAGTGPADRPHARPRG